ncbi:uncharacterized protein RJT21DRAFT_118378 [Scheffersomyces amazonensis]|uniref:uncharacterized protein n=1 Tax=Scheffersomyces amazonensis TaxID=1078765 RepID=UPI00315D57F3
MTKDININQSQRAKSAHKLDQLHKRHKYKNSRYNKCFQNYYHSYQYLTPNPVYIPNIKTSVNHWQLRDLLQFDATTNSVFYTKSDSVYRYNLNDNIVSNHCKLNYYPRCFSHSHNGILVSGGLLNSSSKLFSMNIENLSITGGSSSNSSPRKITKGLFSFHNPNLNISKSVRLGEMINNGVTVYPTSENSYQSFVCNNDSYLYCVDIHNNDSIKVVNKFNCETNTCLNNVVKNPSSDKLLTVTGDSTSIFLIDPTSSNPKVKTIKSGHESGFGISYHNNGYLFSTVFQDGSCLLYDIRNIPANNKPLIEIKSTRPGHQSGAFRVCKFSPENEMTDLLIISEHVGRVHVIDLRNLNYDNVDDHQVLVVPYALDQFAEFKNNIIKNYERASTNSDFIEEDDQDSHKEQYESKRNLIEIYDNPRISGKRRSSNLASSFPSPLVYDYDYLTNVNPKLFKDFVYVPPPPPIINSKIDIKSSNIPDFNYPEWNNNQLPFNNNENHHETKFDNISPTASQRPSFAEIDIEIQRGEEEYERSRRQDGDEFEEGDQEDINNDYDYDYDYFNGYQYNLDYNYNSPSNNVSSGGMLRTSSILPQVSTSMDSYANYSANNCDDSFQQSINHIHGEMELSGIEFCFSKYDTNSKILIGCQDAGIVSWDVNTAARRSFGKFDYV